ncbi:MAG: hypothetical protein ABWJ98_02505 [Hydrogenothermaceae bacterium]
MDTVINYILPILIFAGAGYFLFKKYRSVYQKGKCASCSSYCSCQKSYKVEIK